MERVLIQCDHFRQTLQTFRRAEKPAICTGVQTIKHDIGRNVATGYRAERCIHTTPSTPIMMAEQHHRSWAENSNAEPCTQLEVYAWTR